MSIFDSIISESSEKFNLGDKAGSLLSSLLSLMTDRLQGGFAGFLDRFRLAGLGDTADSWINVGGNMSLSGEQVESGLGTDTVNVVADRAGLDRETTKSALGKMIPDVVDRLTPDGVVPTEDDLLSRIGGFLTGSGTTTTSMASSGAAEAGNLTAGETLDRIGTAATDTIDRHKDFDGMSVNAANNSVENQPLNRAIDTDDYVEDSSPLKWLIPLIILGLLTMFGWAFCGKVEAPPATNTALTTVNSNVNANLPTTNSNVNP